MHPSRRGVPVVVPAKGTTTGYLLPTFGLEPGWRFAHQSSTLVALNGTPATQPMRITSIDALRGFVMFMMIFVNDLAGAGKIVPDWMVHFSDRHRGGSGMTFVDMVFPAFLFIVGMSVPFSLGARLAKGQTSLRTLGHVAIRTLSLLFIGILMV